MRKTLLGLGAALLAAAVASLAGCGSSVSGEDAPCKSDGDCAAHEFCEPLPAAKRSTNVAAPCFTMPAPCSDDTSCSGGSVCWASNRVQLSWAYPNCYAPPKVCAPKCPSTQCYADEVCEESGHCRTTLCNELDALACPAHWVCDLAAAASEPNAYAFGATDESPNYLRDIERGCARLRCDEAGGLTCKENWVCDPANATDPSGCVAVSCQESGRCSDDELFICEPTNSPATRPEGSDAHGCVARNCDEGFACLTSETCDATTEEPELRGCRLLNCEEGQICGQSQYCDPAHELANLFGCVYVPPDAQGGTGSGGGAGTSARAGNGGSGATAAGGGGSAGRSGGGAASSGGGSGTGTGGAGGSSDPDDASVGRCVGR
jgi:hypothetical protein